MGFTVYYSDKTVTASAGFGRVAEFPCIFDARPGYHRLASRYLIDRGLGVWSPHARLRGTSERRPAPTAISLRNYAHWLANFLEWCDTRVVDIFSCDYAEHVQGRYQTEMLKGLWSRDAEALSPQTVNLRVQQACDFLTWMVQNGYRSSFEIPYEMIRRKSGSATSSFGHQAVEIPARTGKVRKSKRRLRMPTDMQVKKWLELVYAHQGHTKGLMCETVLMSAMRREEVACWRIDTLPERRELWHVNNPDAPLYEQRVLITIRFGTKGPCYGYDHGDKIGPERSIWIPLDLAVRLDDYRKRHRNPALKLWIKAGATLHDQKKRTAEAVHLFLAESTGERLTGKDLYNAWTGVELPFKGWSPHLGRDWWACSVLWAEMKKHEHLVNLGVDTAAALLESTAMSIIRLQIQPQLGHAHDSTTMVYLQWISDLLGVTVPKLYEESIERMGPLTRDDE